MSHCPSLALLKALPYQPRVALLHACTFIVPYAGFEILTYMRSLFQKRPSRSRTLCFCVPNTEYRLHPSCVSGATCFVSYFNKDLSGSLSRGGTSCAFVDRAVRCLLEMRWVASEALASDPQERQLTLGPCFYLVSQVGVD